MPLLVGLCWNIAVLFGVEKLEWCAYPMVKKSLRICLTVSTECRHVTDRWTDGRTDGHLMTA